MNGIHKPTGNGTTHRIREQLNFKDNKKWKQFSSRRLELIDKFGLSERKASEQDDNIRQIATILRTEFGYPVSSAAEFEKLVTAAVQSVRRNRKRCTKTRSGGASKRHGGNISSGGLSSGSDMEDNFSRISSPILTSNNSVTSTASSSFQPIQSMSTLPVLQPKPVRIAAARSMKLEQYTSTNGGNMTVKTIHKLINYNELLSNVLSDLVHNQIPLKDQSTNDNNSELAELAVFTQQSNLLSLALASSKDTNNSNSSTSSEQDQQNQRHGPEFSNNETIQYFLREKILVHIQKSKTCTELSMNSQLPEHSMNLCMLGDSCIRAALSFVIERFFSNLDSSSVEYIFSNLTSLQQLASISTKLFASSTSTNMNILPLESKLTLLQLVIGSIVKDFGFDPCIYPLGEIFHDTILRQYPLACNASSSSEKTAILTTVSMKPQLANQDINRKVLLKFQEKEQRFTFPLLSNGPPTISEILENSRHLFQISSNSGRLALYHKGHIIKDDTKLATILNQFTSEETVVELREVSDLQEKSGNSFIDDSTYNGLTILSNVSTTAATTNSQQSPTTRATSSPLVSNYTHTNTASVAALDSIISRISSPVAMKTQSTNGEINAPPTIRNRSPQQIGMHSKSPFDKGLPQPVFQPLL
ncbi:uncharacterized protein Ecym_4329 [Eremothecium cymbalariae DBVPG|uniref:Transcription factor VHR1 n=1 Tax=Eremothecium cymbalariae (strain CBS 270.75 / DBVPG 7215 / KCTC 17166 / NRRL Y-17582) TaxID=931890 RepID=G8JTN8_ERECY|nr:hypothetical protein Ecym_4329 [Eremothecium cymbalariae DBVPG\